MPAWLAVLLGILPEVPQDAAALAEIFKPHAGTDTGTKIAQTLGVVNNLAQGLEQFAVQHQAALVADPQVLPPSPVPSGAQSVAAPSSTSTDQSAGN